VGVNICVNAVALSKDKKGLFLADFTYRKIRRQGKEVVLYDSF